MTHNTLPPSLFIVDAASYLDPESQVLSLDGCEGRNSLYLANLGHRVISLTSDANVVMKGPGSTDGCNLVVPDMWSKTIADPDLFDAVILNEALHLIPEVETTDVIDTAKSLTLPGGLNVVSGYVATDDIRHDTSRYLKPGQLLDTYLDDPRWRVLVSYDQQTRHLDAAGQFYVNGISKLIARKRP